MASRSISDVLFRFLADTKSLDKGSKKAAKDLKGVTKASKAMDTATTQARKALATLGLAFGARELVQGMKSSIDAANDFDESINALEVTTGDAADTISALGETSAEAFGLSKTELNEAAVAFSNFGKDIDSENLAGVFESYAGRATDFASVMNIEVSDAMSKFQSALAGESEPMRRFGVNLSAAAVEAHAAAVGIGEVGRALTDQEKVQARYSLLMEETANTQGDFANTADSATNKTKVLSAQMANLQIEIGEGLQPVYEKFLDTASKSVPVLKKATDGIDEFSLGINTAQRWSRIFGHRVTFGLIDPVKKADDALWDFNRTLDSATQKVRDGRGPIETMGDWMIYLADNGTLTADNLDRMAAALGLTSEEMLEAARRAEEYAGDLGLTSTEVGQLTTAQEILNRELTQRTIASFRGGEDAAGEFGDAVDGVTGDVSDLNAELYKIKDMGKHFAAIKEQTEQILAGKGIAPGTGGVSGGGTIGFAKGGVVPGPAGAPMNATVHGGEVILNREQQRAVGSGGGVTVVLNGFVGDPVALAQELENILEIGRRTGG